MQGVFSFCGFCGFMLDVANLIKYAFVSRLCRHNVTFLLQINSRIPSKYVGDIPRFEEIRSSLMSLEYDISLKNQISDSFEICHGSRESLFRDFLVLMVLMVCGFLLDVANLIKFRFVSC